jgi:hypothetical protein
MGTRRPGGARPCSDIQRALDLSRVGLRDRGRQDRRTARRGPTARHVRG